MSVGNLGIIHIGMAVLGQSLLGISSGVSLIYLIQENRLKKKLRISSFFPSLEALEVIHFRILVVGFLALTFGILTGTFWANQIWKESWFWESKQIWTFAGWLMYAVVLQRRFLTGLRGRRAAWYSIVAFGILLFNFFGLGKVSTSFFK